MDFREKEHLTPADLEWVKRALVQWRIKAMIAKSKPGEWILAHIEMSESNLAIFNCGMWEPVQISPAYLGRRQAYWAKFQVPKNR